MLISLLAKHILEFVAMVLRFYRIHLDNKIVQQEELH